MPQVTAVAKQNLTLPVGELEELLDDERHEVRLEGQTRAAYLAESG